VAARFTGNRSFLLAENFYFFVAITHSLLCLNYNNNVYKLLAKSFKKKDNPANINILQHDCPNKKIFSIIFP
jgi:hypothetical protein